MEKIDSITSIKSEIYHQSSKKTQKVFCDDAVYHATLCSYAVSTCDTKNFKDFFKDYHHSFDEASLSIPRDQEVDRYLIARKAKTYFIAFKGELLLSDWQKQFTSFAEGIYNIMVKKKNKSQF